MKLETAKLILEKTGEVVLSKPNGLIIVVCDLRFIANK